MSIFHALILSSIFSLLVAWSNPSEAACHFSENCVATEQARVLQRSSAGAISWGPVVQKGDPGTERACPDARRGQICYMPHNTSDNVPVLGATEYCLSLGHGSRLPLSYEFAMVADPEAVSLVAREGFSLISEFFFNYYVQENQLAAHQGSLGNGTFWTDTPIYDWGYYLVFNNSAGRMETVQNGFSVGERIATRCVTPLRRR